MNHSSTAAAAIALAAGLAGTAAAQSDPSTFGTVFNIGTVPPGSIFDVPGAVTGTSVGDGDVFTRAGLLTPTFLGGETLGSDSQLNLFDGGEILAFFEAGLLDTTGSNIEVNILGGSVGSRFAALSGSTVNISGGTVGFGFRNFSGSTVNISGGTFGDTFDANGGTVNISGGTVGDGFDANPGSTVNISGGSVGGAFEAFSGSTVNISGGTVGGGFDANSGSTVNLFGTSFILDGVELTNLVLGEAFTITDRNVTLTGVLADGSVFDFDLFDSFVFPEDYFDTNASLTVTLVPTPGATGVLSLGCLLAMRRRR